MARLTLQLPVIQNWSCHNCGGCCREHLIEITAEEKRRIDQQNWSTSSEIPGGQPVTRAIDEKRGRYRLEHQPDGACVFLNEQGLCRIHAKFGESAKPLACRVYPYAYHPFGSDITVSLRFSCPSVVRNLGRRVVEQKEPLQQVAQEVVPRTHRAPDPPYVCGRQTVDWPDLTRFLTAFDEALTDHSVDFATQLMRILAWLEIAEQWQYAEVCGARLQQFLDVVTQASRKAQPDSDLPVIRPSRTGRVMFRQMVAQLLRHDTEATARAGLQARLHGLLNGLRFTFGSGRIPRLPDPPSVVSVFGSHNAEPEFRTHFSEEVASPRFRDVEGEFGGRAPEIDRLMNRYFRVKIQGLHFCGSANFDMPLIDGFRSLALMYPAVLWVARIRAASHQRSHIELADVQATLATLDHNFAYSPALGDSSARKRIQILSRLQQISSLCGWYSR